MQTSKASFHWIRSWYMIRRRGSNFFGSQWAGGVILVIFTIIALIIANLDATKHIYHKILNTEFGLSLGGGGLTMTVETWINDALMAIFFFVVGLEIKRELIVGRLSTFKQAIMPVAGAIGGMLFPALIYIAFNAGTDFEQGWAIPTATDIAFVVGVMALLGDKVPVSMKVFITALAIADDLGAIVVIALFYSSQLNFLMLGIGLAIFVLLFIMNKRGITSMWAYLLLGIIAWYMFLHSGIHATISGVLLAMTMPTRPRFSRKYFMYKQRYFLEEFRFYDRPGKELISNENQMNALLKMKVIANAAVSPAQRMEHFLGPLVTFFIMPVFALANSGVEIKTLSELMIFDTTQGLGIFFGLVVGKPLGIFLFSFILIKTGLGAMPKGVNWLSMFCVCCLAGIGFTMSIFIDTLAFAGTEWIDTGKIAILMGSIGAAVIGSILVNMVTKRDKHLLKHGKMPKNQLGIE